MARMFGVLVGAGVGAIAAYAVAGQSSDQRALDDSGRFLDNAISGGSYADSVAPWYAEPVTAALVVGAAILIIGFMFLMASGRRVP